ncbi:MAG: hypothetical protein H2038_13050 [Brevundimonas sp.]|uniref:hypothetical protein n=1 Tax=Brevundimonas sp. TaxID=1871086 RepID=UPI0017D807E3|nr:hypothetical protein [Brevundimonas sp.]MBA4805570.1 hypothetical protein [Brevundimonas sp.]
MSMIAAVLAAALAASAPQDPPGGVVAAPQEAATELDAITVRGRLEDRSRAFVEEVSRAPGRRPLARWNSPICAGVMNMQADSAQFLIDRIATVAAVLGVESGEPGCDPNLMILMARSENATEVMREAVRERVLAFSPSRNGTDLGREKLDEFVNSDAPVRWWHIALPVSAETGAPAIALDGEDPPDVVSPGISRLHPPIRNDLVRVFVVIDADRVAGVSLAALSNYVAMVALAQVDPETDMSESDTILNLFNPSRPGGGRMTDWDAAFLLALYDGRSNPVGRAAQQRELARDMVSELTGSGRGG